MYILLLVQNIRRTNWSYLMKQYRRKFSNFLRYSAYMRTSEPLSCTATSVVIQSMAELAEHFCPKNKFTKFFKLSKSKKHNLSLKAKWIKLLGYGVTGMVLLFVTDDGTEFAGKVLYARTRKENKRLMQEYHNELRIKYFADVRRTYDTKPFNLLLPQDVLSHEGKEDFILSCWTSYTFLNAVIVMPVMKTDLMAMFRRLSNLSKPPPLARSSSSQRQEDIYTERQNDGMDEFSQNKQVSDQEQENQMTEMDVVFMKAFLTIRAINTVAELHTRLNCVHLDIKPQNIMLGNKGRVYLGDFASLKRVGEWTRFHCFSACYCSPEQAYFILNRHNCSNGMMRADKYIDAWQLGAALYVLWFNTPVPLVDGNTANEVLESLACAFICRNKEHLIPENSQMPPEIYKMIQGFLTINPKERLLPEEAIEQIKRQENIQS